MPANNYLDPNLAMAHLRPLREVSPLVRDIRAAAAPTELEQLRREVANLRETIEERIPPPSPLLLGAEMWREWRRLTQ